MFRSSSLKKNIDSLLAAAAGSIIIFLFTRHGGIGIEPDSVVYLTTAENLHVNSRLVDFTQSPLIDFPAFYPFLLSCIMFVTGLKTLSFAPGLNAILFAALIYLSGYMMEHFLHRSKWNKWAVLGCIVLSPCLLDVYSFLMSETVFLVLLLLFFVVMHRYFRSYSRKTLIVAALIASLASLTRYAGITVVATGGILLLLDLKRTLLRKLIDILLYGLISSAPLIINLLRNYSVSTTFTGGRERSVTSLHENMHDAGSVFYDWLPFLHGHYAGAMWFFILVITGLAFICLKRFLHDHRLAAYEDIIAFFSLLYLLFIVVVASFSRFETLNGRFLSPGFIPLICVGSNQLVKLYQTSKHSAKKWWLTSGVIFFLFFQFGQLAADGETWDGVKDAGVPGYTEDQWRYSETVQFIQKDSLPFKKGYTIYSDANDAVYFFTGRAGEFLPHKEYKRGLDEFLNDHHCYVVWFDDGENIDLVDKTFITAIKKMKLLKQFNDGAIYGYDEQAKAQ